MSCSTQESPRTELTLASNPPLREPVAAGASQDAAELPFGATELRAAARALAQRAAVLLILALVAVAAFVLFGGRATALLDAAARALHADWRWVLAAVAFEALSFAGYIVLFRLVAGRASTRVGLRASAEITFAGAATTRLLPTAGLGGLALTVWALRRAGLALREATATTIAFLYLLYWVYMAALLFVGAALIVGLGSGAAPVPLALGGAIIAALVSAAALLVGRAPSATVARPRGQSRLGRLRAKLVELGPALARGRTLAGGLAREHSPALLGALVWWGFDLAVLWSTFHAFGAPPPILVAIMAYFVGTLANTVPLPGAVSTSMVAVHVAFGLPIAVVIPAVLAYRAVAIWLPAVAGAIALAGLQRTVRAWGREGER